MQYKGLKHCFKIMRNEIAGTKGLKLKIFIFLYRLASYAASANRTVTIVLLPLTVLYRFYSEILIGLDWPACVIAGPGLRIYHGYAIVIHPKTIIGANFSIRQGVTIGNKQGLSHGFGNAPCIGDNVDLGANSVIIGDITVGNNVAIGAGTVISKSVGDGMTVVGAPFRVLGRK